MPDENEFTRLDRFAMAAMKELLSTNAWDIPAKGDVEVEDLAKEAYAIARAMEKERTKRRK